MLGSLFLSLTQWSIVDKPEWVGVRNYQNMLFHDPRFWVSLFNTAYYVFLSVPLSALLALFLAILLNRKLRAVTLYRGIFYLPVVTSGVATAILWAWIFNPRFGVLNYVLSIFGIEGPGWLTSEVWSKPAFIIMNLWNIGSPMLIYLAALQSIPQHLYEAAELDGANHWQQFRYVTFPMLSPTTLFVLVIGIIGSFQIFTPAYVITAGSSTQAVGGPNDSTLFYVLYLYQNAFQFFKMGYASAQAWVLFVVIVSLTALQFRLSKQLIYYEGLRR
jgi:multiple sugar transport system permease protein